MRDTEVTFALLAGCAKSHFPVPRATSLTGEGKGFSSGGPTPS